MDSFRELISIDPKEYRRQYNKQYYQENKAKLKEANIIYRITHKEQIKQSRRRNRLKNYKYVKRGRPIDKGSVWIGLRYKHTPEQIKKWRNNYEKYRIQIKLAVLIEVEIVESLLRNKKWWRK